MKSLPAIVAALALFAQARVHTTAGPLAREHWQRTVTLPAASPVAEQCVVLDADVFAHAAPGLRDVRLLQEGHELPYAVDESHDEREAGTETTPADDRSIFDAVAVAPLRQLAPASVQRTGAHLAASFTLPAHVPLERISLHGVADGPVAVEIRAMPRVAFSGNLPIPEPEIVSLRAVPGRLSLPVTLGANLQSETAVSVDVSPVLPALTAVAFEMRRREVCYQPRTAALVQMVFGDLEATPVHYDYAAHYKPTSAPLLATLGPLQVNPAYQPPVTQSTFGLTTRQKIGIAIVLCLGMMAVTIGALFAMQRR